MKTIQTLDESGQNGSELIANIDKVSPLGWQFTNNCLNYLFEDFINSKGAKVVSQLVINLSKYKFHNLKLFGVLQIDFDIVLELVMEYYVELKSAEITEKFSDLYYFTDTYENSELSAQMFLLLYKQIEQFKHNLDPTYAQYIFSQEADLYDSDSKQKLMSLNRFCSMCSDNKFFDYVTL